jgi:hypothetical protein
LKKKCVNLQDEKKKIMKKRKIMIFGLADKISIPICEGKELNIAKQFNNKEITWQ